LIDIDGAVRGKAVEKPKVAVADWVQVRKEAGM
jgi:hypothetical protein